MVLEKDSEMREIRQKDTYKFLGFVIHEKGGCQDEIKATIKEVQTI